MAPAPRPAADALSAPPAHSANPWGNLICTRKLSLTSGLGGNFILEAVWRKGRGGIEKERELGDSRPVAWPAPLTSLGTAEETWAG